MATQPTSFKYFIQGSPGDPNFSAYQSPFAGGGGGREVSQEEANQITQQHLQLRKQQSPGSYQMEANQFAEALKPKSSYQTYQNPFTGETLRNVSQETVNQLQQQQADLAAGKIRQIAPGQFVPIGSPAANLLQQQLQGQQTPIQQQQFVEYKNLTDPNAILTNPFSRSNALAEIADKAAGAIGADASKNRNSYMIFVDNYLKTGQVTNAVGTPVNESLAIQIRKFADEFKNRGQQTQIDPNSALAKQPTTTQAGIQPTQPQTQFGPSSYTGPSIMDYLSSKGQNPSFSSRSQLAAQFLPGQTYTGTPEQNTELLNKLRSQQAGTPAGGVPGATTLPPTGTQPQQPQTYTVKSGDTLSQIAASLGVNWKTDITGFKSGDPDLIFPGEVLTIKKAFTPTPSTDLPPPEPKDTGIGGAGDTTPPPPEQTVPLTPAEEDYSKVLQQRSYDDYVDSFAKRLGLDDLKKQLGDLNLALEAVKQRGIKKREDINNNPWISEELRGRKIANADRASKEEESLALEQFNLVQKQYDNAREEIKFAAKMAVDQQNEDRDFYFKTKEAALEVQRDALKDAGIDTQVISAGNRQLLINSQTGETIKDLGTTTFKPTAGTTGVPPQEIEDLDTQIYGLMGQLSPQQLDELISLGLL